MLRRASACKGASARRCRAKDRSRAVAVGVSARRVEEDVALEQVRSQASNRADCHGGRTRRPPAMARDRIQSDKANSRWRDQPASVVAGRRARRPKRRGENRARAAVEWRARSRPTRLRSSTRTLRSSGNRARRAHDVSVRGANIGARPRAAGPELALSVESRRLPRAEARQGEGSVARARCNQPMRTSHARSARPQAEHCASRGRDRLPRGGNRGRCLGSGNECDRVRVTTRRAVNRNRSGRETNRRAGVCPQRHPPPASSDAWTPVATMRDADDPVETGCRAVTAMPARLGGKAAAPGWCSDEAISCPGRPAT